MPLPGPAVRWHSVAARRVALVSFMVLGAAAPGVCQVPNWVVPSAPRLVIGARPGEEIGLIRGAAMHPDGRIALIDQHGPSVLLFHPDGRLLRTLGRSGQGPGEFSDPFGLGWIGDSVYIADSANRRITVFLSDGRMVRDQRLDVPFVIGEIHRFADGRWVVRRQNRFGVGRGMGLARDTIEYFVLDETMRSPAFVARVPGVVGATLMVNGSPGVRTAPFSPRPVAAVWGRCLYQTTTDLPRVVLFTSDTQRVSEVTFRGASRRVTMEDRESFLKRLLARIPSREREQLLPAVRTAMPFPENLPLTQGMVVDALGYVWLQRFEPGDQGRTFRILGPTLEDLGDFDLPVPLYRLVQVGSDFVLGIQLGPQDEERLLLLSLDRGRSGARSEPPTMCHHP